jgi:hypothetical protein
LDLKAPIPLLTDGWENRTTGLGTKRALGKTLWHRRWFTSSPRRKRISIPIVKIYGLWLIYGGHAGAINSRIRAFAKPSGAVAPEEGFEPPTQRLTAACSTTELLRINRGGADRTRTGVHGFAGRCVATPPPRPGIIDSHPDSAPDKTHHAGQLSRCGGDGQADASGSADSRPSERGNLI